MARARRLLRRLAAGAALAGLALVVLVVGLAIAVGAGFQRERLRAAAEEALERAAGTPVRIEALEGPLVPSATARGVRIGPEDAPLASARALRLELGGVDGSGRITLVVSAVEAEDLALTLDASGSSEPGARPQEAVAEEAQEGDPEPSWWQVRFRSLRAEEARITVRGLPPALAPSGALSARGDLHLARLELPWSARAARRAEGELALALVPSGEGAAFDHGRLVLALDQGRLRSEALALEGPGGRVAGEATLALGPHPGRSLPGPGELRLRFERVDAARLTGRTALASSLGGRLELALAAPGPEAEGTGLGALGVALELDPSQLPGAALDAGSLRARFRGLGAERPVGWTIERARLEGKGVRVEAEGRGRGASAEALGARASVDALERVEPWLAPLLGGAPALEGSARLEADLSGTLREPSGRLRAEGRGLAVAGVDLGVLDADLSLPGDGSVRIETLRLRGGALPLGAEPGGRVTLREGGLALSGLTLRSDAQSVALDGGLERGRFRDLALRVDALDLARLAALPGLPEGLGGRVTGTLRLDGPFERARVEGELAWSEPSLAEARAERLELALVSEEERIRVDGTLRAHEDATLELGGELPRDLAALAARGLLEHPGTALELRARGIDAALFAPLLPRTLREPGGRLRGDLAFRGSARGPVLTGRLSLEAGRITVPLLGHTFAPIEGTLALEGERLRVEALRVGESGAEGVLRGEVALRGLRPERLDLALALRHLPVARSALLRTDATGALTASGPLDSLRVRGGVVLEDLEVQLPEPRDPVLKEIRVVTGGNGAGPLREAERDAGPLEGAEIDLALTVPRGSRLRGRGADLEIAGVFVARKEPDEATRFAGEASVVRGRWSFYGRRFEIRRGEARLAGERLLDPTLDVVAAHPAGTVTVVAYVEGRASDPRVRLESEPPLPDADVLAYLLFGRPASELAGEHQGALRSAATQAAAGVAATELSRILGDRLPVDTVDVRFAEDGGPSTLGVGKYLSDRAFVRYDRTLGPEPEDQVVIEYRLTPSWSVESELTSEGNAGADLIWHYDY